MRTGTKLFYMLFPLILFSCSKDVIEVDRNKELFLKYDGTYTIVSAYLDEPYDLNFDGIASTNLLAELPEIKDSDLQVYISSKTRFLIIQWSEQYPAYSGSGEPYFIYAKQGPHLDFDINEDGTEFVYRSLKDDGTLSDDKMKRFASPIRLTIENDGRIKALITKMIYTEEGVKDLLIEATFKKSLDNDRVYR